MSVEQLIRELQQCDQKMPVVFQTGVDDTGPRIRNHVNRVDRSVSHVTIVVEKGL